MWLLGQQRYLDTCTHKNIISVPCTYFGSKISKIFSVSYGSYHPSEINGP